MAFRGSQQEKFKNIVLKVEPIRSHSPDMQTSNLIKPTSSPTNHTSAPRNIHKYFAKEPHNRPADTSQILTGGTNESNSHTQPYSKPQHTSSNILTDHSRHPSTHLITSQIQQTEQALINRLQSQIHEKAEIIAQLKNIIRISNENNSKGKYKAILLQEKSPQRKSDDQERQLKELRHNVKILTIENNSLSDYIDRLKATLGLKQVDYIDLDSKKQERDQLELHRAKQINRLNQIIRQQELQHEQKIDQLVSSHRSLAHQYKLLQQEKNQLYHQNKILAERLRQSQQNYQRLLQSQDERFKNSSTEKFTIQKIKEQYSKSLSQFKETVAYETDHLFDQFSSHLEKIARKVSFLEGKITSLQENLRKIGQKDLKQSVARKKSDIYIEEGADSSVNSNSRRKLKNLSDVGVKTVFTSRVYQQNLQSEGQATVPLRTEIIRLKSIVNELQNQISQRSDYYTFRQRQFENSSAELSSYKMKYALKDEELLKMRREREANQKELLQEIDRHKTEIDKLQLAYKTERTNIHETYVTDIQEKDNIIEALKTEISTLRQRYDQYTSEMKRYASSARLQHQLQDQNQRLRGQLQECVDKIEQYKKLCLLMKEQALQSNIYQQILKEMRGQIYLIRQKYHQDLSELSQLQHQKEQLIALNQDINLQLEDNLNKVHEYQQDEVKLREVIRLLETQKGVLAQRVGYLESNRLTLQKEIMAKDEAQRGLIEQKIQLQKQIAGYLNLVRKKSLQDTKEIAKSRCIHQEFGLEQLLTNVERLEATLNQQRLSKQQKHQQIAKVLSEAIVDH